MGDDEHLAFIQAMNPASASLPSRVCSLVEQSSRTCPLPPQLKQIGPLFLVLKEELPLEADDDAGESFLGQGGAMWPGSPQV
jgi:hypothetical protein